MKKYLFLIYHAPQGSDDIHLPTTYGVYEIDKDEHYSTDCLRGYNEFKILKTLLEEDHKPYVDPAFYPYTSNKTSSYYKTYDEIPAGSNHMLFIQCSIEDEVVELEDDESAMLYFELKIKGKEANY